MNIRKSLQLYNDQKETYSELLERSGIIRYKRTIDIYANCSKNENSVDGHDIIKTVSCVITNYSVSKIKSSTQLMLLKSIYIATLEIKNFSSDNLDETIIPFILHKATFKPEYGFVCNHITDAIGKERYIDYGLSLLNYEDTQGKNCHVVNFSDNKIISKEMLQDSSIVITPKYYTSSHRKNDRNMYLEDPGYVYDLHELVDNKTEVHIIPFKLQCSYYSLSKNKRFGYNTKLAAIVDFFNTVFGLILLNCIEKIEFKYYRSSQLIQFTDVQYFDKFYNTDKILDDMKILTTELNTLCNTFDFKNTVKCLFYYSDNNRDKIKIIYENGDELQYNSSRYNSLQRFIIERDDYAKDIHLNENEVKENILIKSIEFLQTVNLSETLNAITQLSQSQELLRLDNDYKKLE